MKAAFAPHPQNPQKPIERTTSDFLFSPKDCIAKLEAAIGAGARQFWMSIHFDDKARFLLDWARDIMPAFR